MTRTSSRKVTAVSCNEPQQPSNAMKLRCRKYIPVIESDSDSDIDLYIEAKPRTPRKQKGKTLVDENQVSPSKQQKFCDDVKENSRTPPTPSSLLNKLELCSPQKAHGEGVSKQLFGGSSNAYQSARRALHSTLPASLPGREKELERLRDFIVDLLERQCSGSLYISGPPGTGKTASLGVILKEENVACKVQDVYINCTAIKSSGSVYSRIVKDLNVACKGKTEKDYIRAIEKHLINTKKTILLILDEIDQLDNKKQTILYTIFEWPSIPDSKLILIGIANALDLTDRILPRLQARCELKPALMHFASYSKQQIVDILTRRLEDAGALSVFSPVALQMLAGKVAAVSGDVRRALDIGRRVIELSEHKAFKSIENLASECPTVELQQVVGILNSVYGTVQHFGGESEDSFPLQQKILICSLVLILKKSRNKDVTLGRLHDVYRKVCAKRNLMGVDQGEFVGLCALVEARGVLRVSGKKEARLSKVRLEWDEGEVEAALGDKQLMAQILEDGACLGVHK